MKIIEVRERSNDYHAQIKDHPEFWGCGKNHSEAVGDLVRSHPDEFDLVVITNPLLLNDGR